jgi:acyl carrier protein
VIDDSTAATADVGSADTSALLVERVRDWLLDRFPGPIDLDADLSDGVLEDSLAFVELLVLVEDLRGEPISSSDVDLENFRTLRTIGERFFDGTGADGGGGNGR